MHARWLSFVVWTLLAASLAYWSLILMSKGPQAPAQTRPAFAGSTPADWTRLFAAPADTAAPVEAADARFQLLGVVAAVGAGQHPGEGVALIAVSGAPARPVRIGQVLDGGLTLMEVNRHDVSLGQNGVVSVRLSLTPGAGGAVAPPMSVPGGAIPPEISGMNAPGFSDPGPRYVPTGAGGRRAPFVSPLAVNPQLPPAPPDQGSQAGDGGADPHK